MSAVRGRYRNGKIILTEPASWPEDTEVMVEPVPSQNDNTLEDDWPTDTESVARWITEFEAIPPLEMTAEEESAWRAARQAQKQHELSRWEENVRDMDGMFP